MAKKNRNWDYDQKTGKEYFSCKRAAIARSSGDKLMSELRVKKGFELLVQLERGNRADAEQVLKKLMTEAKEKNMGAQAARDVLAASQIGRTRLRVFVQENKDAAKRAEMQLKAAHRLPQSSVNLLHRMPSGPLARLRRQLRQQEAGKEA